MIALLTNILPIALGFFAKLTAIRSQQASENQKLMIEALSARAGVLRAAKDNADKESRASAFNRRMIVWVILGLVSVYVMAPVFIPDLNVLVPVVEKGLTVLGIPFGSDQVVYQSLKGLVKFDEIFQWGTLIVEFYFGAQLAKGR